MALAAIVFEKLFAAVDVARQFQAVFIGRYYFGPGTVLFGKESASGCYVYRVGFYQSLLDRGLQNRDTLLSGHQGCYRLPSGFRTVPFPVFDQRVGYLRVVERRSEERRVGKECRSRW